MLHVTPPMATPESLSSNKEITNEGGFVNVDKNTMQHVKFPNIFTIGDCSSSPNSKTAAAAGEKEIHLFWCFMGFFLIHVLVL